ncbi:hypothetical protein [Lentzea sp. NPDC092896]|uniref:hypothetical protein n=1 Tax=Lentzea sp. NPDC092896 TaxID=3364127 RepID=UPI00381FCB90
MKVVELDELVEEIRGIYEKAHAAYEPRPGRPKIRELTGAPDHAVRKAMEVLRAQADTSDVSTEHDLGVSAVVSLDASASTNIALAVAGDESARDELTIAAAELIASSAPAVVGEAKFASDRLLHSQAEGATSNVEQRGVVESALALEQPPAAAVPEPAANGRVVAWTGFVFGCFASIAANVLHTWLPAAQYPPGWAPGLAPQIGAAVWPIGLLLSVEVLSRVAWPPGWAWNLARYGGTGIVALGSAVISYGHQRDLLLAWHYGPLAAAVGPLVLDGLMVISGFALLAISRKLA